MERDDVSRLFKTGQLVTVYRRDGPMVIGTVREFAYSAMVLSIGEGKSKGTVMVQYGQITSVADGAVI